MQLMLPMEPGGQCIHLLIMVIQVNAFYVGLDNVTITNATISIVKANSTVNVSEVVMGWGDSTNVTVTTEGAKGINATIDNKPVTVINNYTIVISDLAAGNYTLTVTTIPDGDHESVNKTVNVIVNKVESTLTVSNMTFDYKATGSVNVSFTGATGVNASVVSQPKATVNVNNGTITVSGLDAGTYTLTVTTIADDNHIAVTKNATITVNKAKTQITVNAITATYNVNKELVITLKDSNNNALSGIKVTVELNGVKTYSTDKNGQVKVSTKGLIPKVYTVVISYAGDNNYVKSTGTAKVTVNKATPKIIAKKKTYKAKSKNKKFKITLKDNTGKPIKNVKVRLIVQKIKKTSKKTKTKTKKKNKKEKHQKDQQERTNNIQNQQIQEGNLQSNRKILRKQLLQKDNKNRQNQNEVDAAASTDFQFFNQPHIRLLI